MAIITDYLSITIRDTLDLHCSQNVAMAAINHRLDRIKPNRRAGFDNNWTELMIWQTLLTMLLDGFVSQLHNWSAHFSFDSKDPRTYHYRSYLTFEPFFMPFNNWWMRLKRALFSSTQRVQISCYTISQANLLNIFWHSKAHVRGLEASLWSSSQRLQNHFWGKMAS